MHKCLFFFLPVFLFLGFAHEGKFQKVNHEPVVKILSPENNAAFDLQSPVHYSISVSDMEDGESKYEEIPSSEVGLEIRYVPSLDQVDEFMKINTKDHAGFSAIKKSNCFSCHSVKASGIGPSYKAISERYSKAKNIEKLVKSIREGSRGVWGTAVMPTHPEIDKEKAIQIVDWILHNANDPNVDYLIGTEGTFRLTSPVINTKEGFILTATYTDHGLPGNSGKPLTGTHVVVIHGK
jgi:cytochrome c